MTARTRAEALTTLREARARLTALIEDLSDEQIEAPATLGGGDWSIKDLIGHLAAWEERALPWVESADGTDGRTYPPTDEFNAQQVERRGGWPLNRVRDEAAHTRTRLIDAIERLDDAAWQAEVPVPGHDPLPRGVLVGMILAGDEHGPFAHDLAHLSDVEAYVRGL